MSRLAYSILWVLAWALTRVLYRFRVENAERIPHRGAAVIVSNHPSYIDPVLLALTTRRRIRFAAAGWFCARYPRLARLLQLIPVQRGSSAVNRRMFSEVRRALEAGELVVIFPEGGLEFSGTLQAFQRGIERIIAETPVPVVPIGVSGIWGSLLCEDPALFWGRLRARVTVRVGHALPASWVDREFLRAEVAALLPED